MPSRHRTSASDVNVSLWAKIEQFIQAKEIQESLIESHIRVCRNLVEISGQSRGRRVDDLVKQVAEGKLELSIHPHVYLLIYDFGEDEKKGRIKNKRLELKRSRANFRLDKARAGRPLLRQRRPVWLERSGERRGGL